MFMTGGGGGGGGGGGPGIGATDAGVAVFDGILDSPSSPSNLWSMYKCVGKCAGCVGVLGEDPCTLDGEEPSSWDVAFFLRLRLEPECRVD